jgi:hypothetical protein
MKAGCLGSASTLPIASSNVARASGLTGFSNPIWESEICTKEKPASLARAAPIIREDGTPPATVQISPAPAQIMHSTVCRRSSIGFRLSVIASLRRGGAPLMEEDSRRMRFIPARAIFSWRSGGAGGPRKVMFS